MALIKCPECGSDVSDKAPVCPKCGVDIALDNSNESANICPDCGNKIDSASKICTNCGYNPEVAAKEKHRKKKTFIISLLCLAAAACLTVSVIVVRNIFKDSSYVADACKELASDVNGELDISAIYTSDKVDDGQSTIDYVYRVYIEYNTDWITEKVLYIVDNEGETYFVKEDSDEKLSCYLTLAGVEIFGIEGYIDSSDDWDKMSMSDISKIEKKVK